MLVLALAGAPASAWAADDAGGANGKAAGAAGAEGAGRSPAGDDAVFAGAVPRGSALEGMSDKVGAAIGRALAERGVRALIDRSTDNARGQGRVEDLQRLLADARGRYLEGDFRGAVSQADEAVGRFEETFAFEADEDAWATWTELMLVRALALSRQDRTRDSDRTLASIASARPGYVPDPGLAPPKFASRYSAILGKLERTRVTIRVTSRPAGAAVLVDGRQVGVTPLDAGDLLPGRHFVSVRLAGERHDEALLVRQGSREVRAELGDPSRLAAERLRSELMAGGSETAVVSAASDVAGDTFVAVVEPGVGSVPVLLGRVRAGRLESVTAAKVSDDLSDVDAVAAALVETAAAADRDAWVDGSDAGPLRERFLSAGEGGGGGEEGDLGPLVFVGLGVGAIALIGGAVIAGIVLFVSQPKNPGGIDVVVDASAL